MIDFITKFFKPLSIIIYALIIWITSLIGIESQVVKNYLSGLAQGLPLLLLIWIYKFEHESNKKLDEKLDNLKKDIDANEDLLKELWNGFSKFLTDDQLDAHLRKIIEEYRTLEDDFAIKKGAVESIVKAKQILIAREFGINFGRILDYPEPYYEKCDKEIIATNIGTISQGFWGEIMKNNNKSGLLDLSREAIERNKNNDNEFTVKRLFIIDKTDISDELHKLMGNFLDIGVQVKYISRQRAEQIAEDNGNGKITKLEDFTVFTLQQSNTCYSGRLENIRATKKIMLISTNTDVIEGLKKQFTALWALSKEYENSEITLD